MKQASGTSGRFHVLCLEPGEDVRISLRERAIANGIRAAAISSAVGSLRAAHPRYADRADGIVTTIDLEVLSLSGTLSGGGMHLHLSVADRDGRMLGGHLLDGSIVRTAVEFNIQEITGIRFTRPVDTATGYGELLPVQE